MNKVAAAQEKPLTDRQREALCAVFRYLIEHGCTPTFRELTKLLGCKGTRAAEIHLLPLRRAGYLTWEWGCPRSIRLTGCRLVAVFEGDAGERLRAAVEGQQSCTG